MYVAAAATRATAGAAAGVAAGVAAADIAADMAAGKGAGAGVDAADAACPDPRNAPTPDWDASLGIDVNMDLGADIAGSRLSEAVRFKGLADVGGNAEAGRVTGEASGKAAVLLALLSARDWNASAWAVLLSGLAGSDAISFE